MHRLWISLHYIRHGNSRTCFLSVHFRGYRIRFIILESCLMFKKWVRFFNKSWVSMKMMFSRLHKSRRLFSRVKTWYTLMYLCRRKCLLRHQVLIRTEMITAQTNSSNFIETGKSFPSELVQFIGIIF